MRQLGWTNKTFISSSSSTSVSRTECNLTEGVKHHPAVPHCGAPVWAGARSRFFAGLPAPRPSAVGSGGNNVFAMWCLFSLADRSFRMHPEPEQCAEQSESCGRVERAV